MLTVGNYVFNMISLTLYLRIVLVKFVFKGNLVERYFRYRHSELHERYSEADRRGLGKRLAGDGLQVGVVRAEVA
jgi:hypothetical protein